MQVIVLSTGDDFRLWHLLMTADMLSDDVPDASLAQQRYQRGQGAMRVPRRVRARSRNVWSDFSTSAVILAEDKRLPTALCGKPSETSL